VNQEIKGFTEIYMDLNCTQTQDFDQIITEAIDQTFSKLGTTVRQTLYSTLENNYNLNRKDIPDRTGEFIKALEAIFGASGLLLEIDIMKNMRQKVPTFKCEANNPDLAFGDYLKSLKRFMKDS
jgi:hypothetical protein